MPAGIGPRQAGDDSPAISAKEPASPRACPAPTRVPVPLRQHLLARRRTPGQTAHRDWRTPVHRANDRQARPAARATRYPRPRSPRAVRLAKPPSGSPAAAVPPSSAPWNKAVAVLSHKAARAATLRWRKPRRCEYSSSRNSSCQLRVTWLSEPIDQLPLWPSQDGRSKMPSPRLASVLGHSTIEARRLRSSSSSPGVQCVACTMFQRASTATCSHSHSTGARPYKAMQSSTSRRCSAMWIWIGISRAGSGRRFAQSPLVDRAQRVQRDAGRDPAALAGLPHGFLRDAQHGIGRRPEAPLVFPQAGRAESRAHVQGGQQRQADAHPLRRAHQCQGHFAGLGIGPALRVVVQIVEFADLRVARPQQLGVQVGGDGLQLPRRHVMRDAVHAVAPAPEVFVAVLAAFGEAGDGPLERVAVSVDQAGQHRACKLCRAPRRFGRRIGRDLAPATVGAHREQHVMGPGAAHPGCGRQKAKRVSGHGSPRSLPAPRPACP